MTTCGLDPDAFATRLGEALRDQRTVLTNLFRTELLAHGTRRSIRLHVLKADNNGRPQVGTLVRTLCNAVLDYCIPRRQIRDAVQHYEKTRSTQRIIALRNEAQNLFTDISNTGEGGELLLFILTETVLNYPQALSKMALKTSGRMHVHGLDGIYISCNGSPPVIRLHFGESKLHKVPKDSVQAATASIAAMLTDEGFLDDARRDYYLLNTYVDLGSPELEESLRGFLDPLDSRFMAPEVCAVLLAGHELRNYPSVFQNGPLPRAVLTVGREMVDVLEASAAIHRIDSFHIDVFLVPFPNLQVFRGELLKELGLK